MALKSFSELRKVDISKHVEKRDGFEYLNWAKCIDLLYKHGANNVSFTPLTNHDGSSLYMSDVVFTDSKGNTNRCYEIRINVTIDDKQYVFQGPVMNGPNPVKDNSMSQQRVWNAQTRAFVKAVAIYTGLGFDLWLKEENKTKVDEDPYNHDIMVIKKRVSALLTEKMKKTGMSADEISKTIGLENKDELGAYIKSFSKLNNIEKNLLKL